MKRENKRDKKVLIILFSVLTCIMIALMIGMTINIKQGKIDISGIISKWTEKEPEASSTNGIEENVRDIDLTRIITGEDTRHTHIYEKRYDSNYHWEQCWMCNNVINKIAHSLEIKGIEDCDGVSGYQTKYCTDGCGYSEQLPKKEHVLNGTWKNSYTQGMHYQYCTGCGHWMKSEHCTDSNGQRIGCNAGTCAICGTVYNGGTHGVLINERCNRCEEKLLDFTSSVEIVNENSTKVHYRVTTISGVELNMDNVRAATDSLGTSTAGTWTFEIVDKNKIGNEYNITELCTANSNAAYNGILPFISFSGYTINGTNYSYAKIYSTEHVSPDNYAPTKNSITSSGNGSIGNFGTKATVTATFTDGGLPDNNVVYMRLLDKDKNTVISDWGAASKNGTTYTRAFDVTSEIREAADVYVQAKDAKRKYNRNR